MFAIIAAAQENNSKVKDEKREINLFFNVGYPLNYQPDYPNLDKFTNLFLLEMGLDKQVSDKNILTYSISGYFLKYNLSFNPYAIGASGHNNYLRLKIKPKFCFWHKIFPNLNHPLLLGLGFGFVMEIDQPARQKFFSDNTLTNMGLNPCIRYYFHQTDKFQIGILAESYFYILRNVDLGIAISCRYKIK